MQIRDIHIEGFGHFRDRKVGGFRPGLNVIHGPNETGKTTLLELVRRVLFGFPDRRENTNFYGIQPGPGQGGRLSCVTQKGETIHISRQPGASGGAVIIGTGAGDSSGDAVLAGYLGHASKDIFRNIFAFTIDELQSLDSLSDKDTQGRLYGAGLGSLSLASAESEIEKMTQELFKPRGSAQRIALAHKRIRELALKLQDIQDGLGAYDRKMGELDALRQRAGRLGQEIDELETRRHALQTRVDLYPVALEGQKAEEELAALEEISDFPEQGLETLARHASEEKSLGQQIGDLRGDLTLNEQRLAGLVVDQGLLGREAEILALKEATQEIRNALRDRPALERERDAASERIGENARQIGAHWDEARIMNFPWTEADRAAVLKQQRELEAARAEMAAAREKLNYHREQMAAGRARHPHVPGGIAFLAWALLGGGAAGALWGLAAGERLFALAMGLLLAAGAGLLVLKRRAKPPAQEDDPQENMLRERLRLAEQNAAELSGRWRGWLAEKGLDAELEPADAERAAGLIREVRARIQERDRISERIARMGETLDGAARRVRTFFPASPPAADDVPARIQHLGQALDAARTGQREAATLQGRIKEQEDKLARLEKRRAENQVELTRFLELAGATGEEDFRRRQAVYARRRQLHSTIEGSVRQIQARVGTGKAFTEFSANLRSLVPGEVELDLERLSGELAARQNQKDGLNQQIGEIQTHIDQLASSDDLLTLQAEMEMEKQKLRQLAGQWAAGRIALAMLAAARGKYERERQPQVLVSAGSVLSTITGGKYVRVFKPMDGDLFIEDNEGGRLGILEMSRGTREQLYLAMRLGLIEEYEKRAEPLPVIMDDVFINFDDARGERVVELLAEFARPRQVIVMTCHSRSLEIYKKHGAHPVHL